MFIEERKLTGKELKARTKIKSALERACQALQEVNKVEIDNPGISAQAIAEKLDKIGNKGDTYDSIVRRLLTRYEKR